MPTNPIAKDAFMLFLAFMVVMFVGYFVGFFMAFKDFVNALIFCIVFTPFSAAFGLNAGNFYDLYFFAEYREMRKENKIEAVTLMAFLFFVFCDAYLITEDFLFSIIAAVIIQSLILLAAIVVVAKIANYFSSVHCLEQIQSEMHNLKYHKEKK